ncbi:hypothetical protein HU200_004075 [Digitaria exilis]|uniref:Uncharacterized protein n=2 Tax=Digitaria exilis TaxID=1010633 RepID=A0A835FU08_9POAL|nr:hypothetical protein HU200_004075 [Digitaria exilis]
MLPHTFPTSFLTAVKPRSALGLVGSESRVPSGQPMSATDEAAATESPHRRGVASIHRDNARFRGDPSVEPAAALMPATTPPSHRSAEAPAGRMRLPLTWSGGLGCVRRRAPGRDQPTNLPAAASNVGTAWTGSRPCLPARLKYTSLPRPSEDADRNQLSEQASSKPKQPPQDHTTPEHARAESQEQATKHPRNAELFAAGERGGRGALRCLGGSEGGIRPARMAGSVVVSGKAGGAAAPAPGVHPRYVPERGRVLKGMLGALVGCFRPAKTQPLPRAAEDNSDPRSSTVPYASPSSSDGRRHAMRDAKRWVCGNDTDDWTRFSSRN